MVLRNMKTTSVGTIVTSFVFLAAASAVAQTSTPEPGTQAPGSERVYKGLFGATTDPLATHALGVTATLAAAYDDDVYGDIGGGGVQPGLANPAGYYGLLLANADYDWRGRHTQVGATASSAFHYYSDRGKLQTVSYTAGVGFSTEFARRTTLLGNQAFAYSPSYLYGLFPGVVPPSPGDVPPAAPDYSAYDTESYAYTSRISVTHGLTRRGQLTGAIEWQYTDFTHEIDLRRDLMSYSATAAVLSEREPQYRPHVWIPVPHRRFWVRRQSVCDGAWARHWCRLYAAAIGHAAPRIWLCGGLGGGRELPHD